MQTRLSFFKPVTIALLAFVLAGCATATPAPTATLLPTPLPPTPALSTAEGATPLPPTPAARPTVAQPTAAQPIASGQTASTSPTLSDEELLAQGKLIFEKTAGGVGCQYCHGMDARGNIGPNIRGKSKEAILQALGTVGAMQQVIGDSLSETDIEAVAAYLKYLETQPSSGMP